ncbi:DUF2971 domain-containing protein [Weissella viridescens]|uniref:DUF2971 domain-containing protein n=1 Tax=Weissella viridescens TaxID=1629 RepID=A0A3P2RDJ0_WEIVI|nr:DUF2971 domain-containing protein [Weissella viridescens]RRG18737.1 DUF2971 domain-containing protein [Weissella viridescens]
MEKYYKYKSIPNYTVGKVNGEAERMLVDTILKQQIYAAGFEELNDPLEGVYLGEETSNSNYLYLQKRNAKIISATRSHINQLMWAHYANQSKGICIGFEVKSHQPQKVNYSNVPVYSNDPEEILTHKTSAWKYENEWRFLVSEGEEGVTVIETETDEGKKKNFFLDVNITDIYFVLFPNYKSSGISNVMSYENEVESRKKFKEGFFKMLYREIQNQPDQKKLKENLKKINVHQQILRENGRYTEEARVENLLSFIEDNDLLTK